MVMHNLDSFGGFCNVEQTPYKVEGHFSRQASIQVHVINVNIKYVTVHVTQIYGVKYLPPEN